MSKHRHVPILSSLTAAALLASVSTQAAGRNVLDGADGEQMEKAVCDAAQNFAVQNVSAQAVSSVQTWCETGDLGEGEGMADRLINMLVGIADDNKDGELDDAEQEVVQIAMNAAADYLEGKGVSGDDIDAIFGEDGEAANAAAQRVCEYLTDNLPDGEEAASDEADDFAFGGGSDAVFDAVYKKRFAVRQGKKVRIMKRVAGVVRLSGAQKVAIRKARMKSHGARAMAKRMKSMRVRKSYNMKPA